MKYHNFTTRWERKTSLGCTRYYFHDFNTEADAIAHARKMDKSGALNIRVYETGRDTDAPYILRMYIPWWE